MQVCTYNYRRNPATRREHFQLSKLFCFFPKVFCKSPEVGQTSVDAIGVTLVLVDYNQNVPKSNHPQLNKSKRLYKTVKMDGCLKKKKVSMIGTYQDHTLQDEPYKIKVTRHQEDN